MAYVKGKIFDRNRYSKKYPLVRAPKKNTFRGDNDLQIEVITVDFENESEKDGYFSAQFENSSNMRILLSPRDSEDSDSAMVALAIDHALTDISKVRINASAPFTGKVDVIVLYVG